MHAYELNPGIVLKPAPRKNYLSLENILIAGAIAFAAVSGSKFLSDRVQESRIPLQRQEFSIANQQCSQRHGVKRSKSIAVVIPSQYNHCYDRLDSIGVSKEDQRNMARTFFTETKHKHFDFFGRVVIGKNKDKGVPQITPIAIEESVSRALNRTAYNYREERNGRVLLKQYFQKFPKKYLAQFNSENKWKRRRARELIVAKLYRLADDRDTCFYIGAAIWEFNKAEASRLSRMYNLPREEIPEITDAMHNLPGIVKLAVMKYRRGWRNHVDYRTQEHIARFSRYEVSGV